VLVLHKLSLVESVEVSVESLGYHWVHHWLACQWAAIELEGLVNLLVGGLEFELLWLVVGHSQLRHGRGRAWLTQSLYHMLMSFQLFHLFLCEITLVG